MTTYDNLIAPNSVKKCSFNVAWQAILYNSGVKGIRDQLCANYQDTLSQMKLQNQQISTHIQHNDLKAIQYDTSVLSRPQNATNQQLDIIFEQNRPNNFFGIRKFKTFDHERLMTNKLNGTVISDVSLADDIIDDLYELAKQTCIYRSSVQPCHLEDKAVKKAYFTKSTYLDSATTQSSACVPDLEYKIEQKRLYFLLVNKYYKFNHHHRHRTYDESRLNETEQEKQIIQHCILKYPRLQRLINNKQFYSAKQNLKLSKIDRKMHEINVNFVTNYDYETDKKRNLEKNLVDEYVTKTIFGAPTSIIDELSMECKEFNGFYHCLLEYLSSQLSVLNVLIDKTRPINFKNLMNGLSNLVSNTKNVPGSSSRYLVQQVIHTGEYHQELLIELSGSVDGWLDQILKCFLSQYMTIRLESYLTVALLFSKPKYVEAIRVNAFMETIYDVCATILRCVDLRMTEFAMYYSLLGVMFQHCQSTQLIDCVIERAPYCHHVDMLARWPRFVYFAYNYWHQDNLHTNHVLLNRLISILENHFIREIISRKAIKEALCAICRRFNVTSSLFVSINKG